MKNVTSWAAAAAVIAVLGACTTEITSDADGGTGSTSATTGAAGSSSTSTSTSTGTGGSGTGGSGGSSGNDGGTCSASANASACETCAFDQCEDETCACKANSGCGSHLADFLTCLSGSSDLASCTTSLATDSNAVDGGGNAANDLGGCMSDCEDLCKGRDGGIRRPRPRP